MIRNDPDWDEWYREDGKFKQLDSDFDLDENDDK
jgi:hypothetical protein